MIPGPRRLIGFLFLGLAGPAAAAESPGPVVELPPVVVTDSRLLPKPEAWRYGRVADFEILSNASDSATRSTVHDLLEFRQAVSVVWPAMQPKSSAPPVYLILCGKKDRFQDFVAENIGNASSGTVSLSLREAEQAALVLDLETTVLNLDGSGSGGTAGAGQTVGVSLSGGGFSASSINSASTGPISEIEVDQRQQLHREYIHFLLGRLNPRPAPWIEEGLSQLLASMTYSRTSIVFAKLPDANRVTPHEAMAAAATRLGNMGIEKQDSSLEAPGSGAAQDKAFNESLAYSALMPMDRMFAVARDSPEALNAIGSLWSKQCWMFVHLCLYGENKRYQRAFIDFVTRSAREPVTEDLFRQCFKMGYKDMLLEFRSYAQDTDYKSVAFKGGKLPEVPELALGDATEPEIGRIKGEALRMAGHAESAHLTLIAPFIRGERDPELLASIGLDELASGRSDRAARFLEAAVAQKTSRARAYLELGRLWLAQAEAKPAGAAGRLSADQMIRVLTPLFAGREVPPPLPQSYETIAEAWSRAEVRPSADNLGVVTQGVGLFPSDSDLIYRDAVLHAENGMKDEARKLAGFGATTARDAAARARFAALKASLVN